MGVETEYAFSAFHPSGKPLNGREIMSRIEHLAGERLPHLPDREGRGMFLANGSRFYRDVTDNGAHQELAGPECTNPWDVVRYIGAGERILEELAGEVTERNRDIGKAFYFKTNVDYAGAGTSWGCHESYLTQTPIEMLPPYLIPHFVTRIVYTGSGGFATNTPGIQFLLSPRVAHLRTVQSNQTQHDRPIFNLRDESLSGSGHKRLHVICGESNSSEISAWLKVATTSLILALVDAGIDPLKAVRLKSPLHAMRIIAADPTCRAKLRMSDKRELTATEVQRLYLARVSENLDQSFMPPWAEEVCSLWETILDRLDAGAPDSVCTNLDWAIKLTLFRETCERAGQAWETLSSRNNLPTQGPPSALQSLMELGESIADVPEFLSESVTPGTFVEVQALRQRLFEIDVRYSILGAQSLFHKLDSQGALDHHVSGVNNIDHAVENPPEKGRARVRGNCTKRFSGDATHYSCDWTGIWDHNGSRFLDLSDPFTEREAWMDSRALTRSRLREAQRARM
jgi:hypothetical protein